MADRYPLVLNGTSIQELQSGDDLIGLAGYPTLAADQTFTGANRGTVTTDNDLSFDLTVTNNFSCTPTAGGSLTFTNIASASGQSGFILLTNNSNYAITAAATTKVSNTALSTISATGVYVLSYFCNGTNVYIVNSAALA